MFVNQPDDAQLVALWHDPETCPAIARRLGVRLADAPVAPPPAAGQAPHGPAAQRQREARGRVQRRRRRPAGPQEMRSLAAAADRRPRRAAVRLVQLEETDAFVSQLVDGVIYVARRSLKGSAKFLWSAIEVASDQNDRRVDVEG